MQTIAKVTVDDIWTGDVSSIEDDAACPSGWVRADAPTGSGQFQWTGAEWLSLDADQQTAFAAAVAKRLVPVSVSMRQARLALLGAGLLSTVQTFINTAPEATQIEWDYATDIWRDRDLVVGIGSTLGLTDAQIDALFIQAAAIP